jgi:hypothetical protein
MASLEISEKLAERLKQIAARQQRPVEMVLEELIDKYDDPLYDAVPEDIEDKESYVKALHVVRPKLYAIAREYWQKVGDQARLALTDKELDEQFWLIDPSGIPRLKTEQGTIELPTDPLDAIIGLIEDGPSNLSSSVRETMAAHYRGKADAGSTT